MTRVQFELIAEVLRHRIEVCPDPVARAALVQVAQDFADRLRGINPRFSVERFMDAAVGPQKETNE